MHKSIAVKFLHRVSTRINRTLQAGREIESTLIFGPYAGIERKLIDSSDPIYLELSKTLKRCRSFLYDVEVFRTVEPETRYLPYLTDVKKKSLDIGANVGFYSALLSPLSMKVLAWEANPHLIPYLTINVRRYPNVSVIPLAAAQSCGEAVFNIPLGPNDDVLCHSGSGGMMSLFINKMGIKSVPATVSMIPVDAFKLDSVGFIKIDVEGSEYNVLEGAAETIDRCRPAITVENEFRHNPECGKVFDFLKARDYRGYFFDRSTQALRSFDEFSLEKNQIAILDANHNIADPAHYVYNFMFVPREEDRLRALLRK